MSLVRKMSVGAKTPTLYTMYGKQYDFDELQKLADQGLAEYLAGLKRGSKDETQFREAYNNIMRGIGDGSITYLDGRFIDTKYGYHNSPDKDKNKDHYGLMANYIFGKMGRSPEYVKPEDKTKTKWNGSESIGNALIRELYNSDTENIRDFIDIDYPDPTTNKRGTTNRAERLSQAFLSVLSKFDTLFTGYTDSDKADATSYINDAVKYLNDGSIDAGDYLALSRAASGLNYRGMFSEEYTTPEQKPEDTSIVDEEPALTKRQSFINWIEQKYPMFSGTLHNPRSLTISKTYGPETLKALSTAMNGLSNDELYRIVRSALSDSKYRFNNEQFIKNTFKGANYGFLNAFGLLKALETLREKHLLQPFGEEAPNLYYIPNTDNSARQTAWVWDNQAGTVLEMSYHDIPYWRKNIYLEWLNSNEWNTDDSYWASRYSNFSFKDGGIIKAYAGAVMDRNSGRGPTAVSGEPNNWLAIENTITNASNTDTWKRYYKLSDIISHIKQSVNSYNTSNGQTVWTPWGSGGYNRGSDGKIITGDDGKTKFGLSGALLGIKLNELELLGANLSWDANLNGKGYEAWNKKFDETGFNNYFGGDFEKFDYMGPSTYNRRALLEQMKTEFTKENPLVIGDDKLYWSGSRWDLALPDLEVNIPKVEVDPNLPKVADIDLGNTDKTDPTKITPVTGDLGDSEGNGQGFLSTLEEFVPDLIGAGRLAISLNTNNRVANTIRPTLTPVLKDTYERFSPVVGDFYTRQYGYKRAGDTYSRFSRPLTSDASLYAHTMLEANRQAAALQSQADAADNQEIKRTAAEALARTEDNMARRSEVANFNRASMNLTNREIAQLEASRLKNNWLSWDNYLKGIEGRLRTRYDSNKNRSDEFRLRVAVNDIENRFQDRIKDANAKVAEWRAANPGVSVTTMPGYRQYEELIKEATKWKDAETNEAYANIYGENYTNPYTNKSWADTASKFSFKNGGTLQPSALYLINKVIRNESNT